MQKTMKSILIIDNNKKCCREYTVFLEKEGYSVTIANTTAEGLHHIAHEEPTVVLLAAMLPEMIAFVALERILRDHPDVLVIVTGVDARGTIEAMRLGAFDVISNPADLNIVKRLLARAFHMKTVRNVLPLKTIDEPPIVPDGPQLIGDSIQMQEVYKLIGIMASNAMTLLIEGETGTGKDLVARAIHAGSARKENSFTPVDCGALPDTLLESELFGYDGGAFTDAKREGKFGRFELADGGTLFLDEIANMTPALQAKLLRALQTQEIERLGGTKRLKLDIRVIAATNRNLNELVKQGGFRMDLYYRLKRIMIQIPPLRERQEDIPLLVKHFMHLTEKELGKSIRGISMEAMNLLQNHTWPGNVRELENCIRSAAVLCRAGVILPEDLSTEIQTGHSPNMTVPLQKNEIPETPYKNLFDLPAPVFCQFISQNPDVTMEEISDWSVELSNEARFKAHQAKCVVDNWQIEWATDKLTYSDLLKCIQEVVENAIPRFSALLHGTDPKRLGDAEPISVEGNTFYDCLEGVLMELEKEYGGDREKLAKVLGLNRKQFDSELSKIKKQKKQKARDTGEETTGKPKQRRRKQFPEEEAKKFLTDPVRSYVGYPITGNEWRAKPADEKIRTIKLALQVLEKRFHGHHGHICCGGMTLEQIREDIYRRATYLYDTETEVAKALQVDLRTFRKYSPHQEGDFPEHYTFF